MRQLPITILARAGYAARGVVYAIVGFFAVLAGFGFAAPKGTRSALDVILEQPAGFFLVWVLIVGLLGYSTWRTVQSIGDTDRHGTTVKGLVIRAGLLGSAVTYILLAIYAIGLVTAAGTGSLEEFGRMLLLPFNAILTNAVAVYGVSGLLLGLGCAHVYKAYKEKYRTHFEADRHAMRFISPISKTGLAARGLVFVVLACMAMLGFGEPEEGDIPSTEDALHYVQDLPFGDLVLVGFGIGLMAFAAYSCLESIYRTVNPQAVGGANGM